MSIRSWRSDSWQFSSLADSCSCTARPSRTDSARGREPWAIEAFAARNLRRLATGSDVKAMQNPIESSPDGARRGARSLRRSLRRVSCERRSRRDGDQRGPLSTGARPARDAHAETERRRAFAIIRNGIRFTGMPGWGGADTDEEIWKLVLFCGSCRLSPPKSLEHMRESKPQDAAEGRHHEPLTRTRTTVYPGVCFAGCNLPLRFLGIVMCAICRDQAYDFLWVSGVREFSPHSVFSRERYLWWKRYFSSRCS